MSAIGRQVMKNSVVRVGGYIIGAGLHFASIVWIGRYLGTEGFGHFSFILAFVGIFQLLTDMGVRHILIRNIAVDREHFRQYLGIARMLLWLLSLVSMGCIVGLANLLHLTDEVRHAMYIAGLAVICTFYGLSYGAVLRAFEEMDWDILGFILHKMIFVLLIWGITKTRFGLQGVFTAMLCANACLWLYAWSVVGIRHGRARVSLDFTAGWRLFWEAFPLGMAEICARVKQHVDKLLLLAFVTPVAVGLYSAAYKFLEAMTPFTMHLTLPLFPVFSRLAQVSSDRLLRGVEQSLKFLYIIGVPPAVILFVFAERIVVLCFGDVYREATVTLRLLAPVTLLLLPASIYSYIFTALGRQRLCTVCVAAALATNVLVDLLLVPFYSHVGAAIGTLVAEAVFFLAGLRILRQMGGNVANVAILWRPGLAGLALGSICWLVKDMTLLTVGLGLCSGLALYAGLLLILQTFDQQEVALLREAIKYDIVSSRPTHETP